MNEPRKFTNPFPGLRPFETDEYRLFFGREGQSDALIARLERARLLAVVGTSGSGKSSLVRAGLLPALRGGLMAGAGSGWRIAIMRPGSDPAGNLARALVERDVLPEAGAGLPPAEAEAVVEAMLRRGSLGLVDAARQGRLGEHEKLLVVVDQFEELFRFRAARAATTTSDDASAFVKLLLEAARQRELSIYVVLTMRSDFLGDCAQFQGLPEAINEGQYLIPRMTRDERRFAITGPVGVTRGKITEPLVNRLLNDVGDNPDQLPILQHALMRTWDYWAMRRRDGEPLGLEHYEAVGTMSDALSRHADEAWDELPDERSRHVAELLFKALTERGADNREIRRPTRLAEVCEIAGATRAEVVAIVEIFRREGRSFLMPPAGVELTDETVIDISHESLIRNWGRLKEWVRDEAEAARIYRRLATAAADYREGAGGLLDDVTLRWVLKWQEKYDPNRAWGERYHQGFDDAMSYLAESRAARDAAVAERERQRQETIERERREREQAERFAAEQSRAAQRLRRFTFALVVISLLALVAAGASVVAFAQAKRSESRARNLAGDLQDSLKQVTAAKEDANHQRDAALAAQSAAVDAQKFAEDEKTRALGAEKKEEAARRDAQEKARLAEVEKVKAQSEEQRAEAEARKNLKAKVANDQFRDGIARAQRGGSLNLSNAKSLLNAAVKGYHDPDVSNDEAIADAKVQLGNLSYILGYEGFVREQGNFNVYGIVESLDECVTNYDEAAKIYASPQVNAPEKAAVAMFTLGNILMKFTHAPTVATVGERGRALGANSLDVEVPNFSIVRHGEIGTAERTLNYDPVEKYKHEAAARYQQAFVYYQQARADFRKTKLLGGEDPVAGMKKVAYQIGSLYLNEAQEAQSSSDRQLQAVDDRQKAAALFERLLNLYPHGDANVARLIALIGALRYDPHQEGAAEQYFDRALAAYKQENPYSEGSAFVEMAQISQGAGQWESAASLYERAIKAYKSTGDYASQADAHYKLGDLLINGDFAHTDPSLFDRGGDNYIHALEAYRLALAKDKDADGAERILKIGVDAVDKLGNNELALKAFKLALEFGQAQNNPLTQARAQEKIGDISDDIDAYKQSLALYERILPSARHRDNHTEIEESSSAIHRLTELIESRTPKP